jgi:hypothetical protein
LKETSLNWEAVSALAEVFGLVAVLVSLIYIGFEVRQNTRQARLSAQRDLVQELGQLSSCLTTNSELASIVIEGAKDLENLSPIEQIQFRSYMNHLFALFEQQHLLHHEGEGDPETWTAVKAMMDDFLATTGCKQWWQQRAHYHTQRFKYYVEQRLNELEIGSG